MIIVHPSQVDPDDTGTECPGAGRVHSSPPTVETRVEALRAARGSRTSKEMVEALGLEDNWSRRTGNYWDTLESGTRPSRERARLIERETGIPLTLLRLS